MVAEDIIIKPIITEKSTFAQSEGKYTFKVSKKATKVDIRNAVEKLFGVKVKTVTTMNMNGKPKRQGAHEGKTSDWKKAIVTIDTDPAPRTYIKDGKEVKSTKTFKRSIEGLEA